MTYTAQQLSEIIDSVYDVEDDEFEDETGYENPWDAIHDETVTIQGVTFEHVESFGGEGDGDTAWVVFKVGDQYFQKDGYYASYDGFYWDGDLYQVESYQKVVTAWRAV